MDIKLFIQAAVKFLLGLIIVALLLFIPAGTTGYWNAWLFIDILFIPMLCAGILLMAKNPDLLRSRLNASESEPEQKKVIMLSGVMFIAGFVLAGLNFRFQWFMLPAWVVIAASVLFLLSYAMFAEVMRENTYLSRTVEVQEGQTVIDTGLYGVVRHPMYFASVILFLSMPLVLGSLFSFIVFLAYPFLIAKRIKNEEELLEKELDGYAEYKTRVKYRLIPFIW